MIGASIYIYQLSTVFFANRPRWTSILSRKNLKSSFGLRCRGILQTALQFKFDFYRVVHLEEEVAWILEAPIDERHVELRAARPMISGKFCFGGYGQFVFAAM